MAFFKRKMREVKSVSDNKTTHYDCDACLWEGIDVHPNEDSRAAQAFAAHDCDDYPVLGH
jgi:hypothetical protein